jgi:phage tail-like protein
MAETSANNYFFLNREGLWPDFRRAGLEQRDDGALQLFSLPRASATLPDEVRTAQAPDAPAGLAIDRGGTLYYSDPETGRIRRILGCDGSVGAAPCLGGAGATSTSLHAPRGLWIPQRRQSLFVADSGHHRVVIFDLDTLQLTAVWGVAGPSPAPGQFDTPWALAGDSAGNVYVVDYGNRRVQQFNLIGEVVPAFWENLSASGLLAQPSGIAVREANGAPWIFVLDSEGSRIVVAGPDGQPVLDSTGQPLVIRDDRLAGAMGMAAGRDSLYVGDNASRRILRFEIADGLSFARAAAGYEAPVAALLLDRHGALWAHPGGSLAPNRLDQHGSSAAHGVLYRDPSSPIDAGRPVVWRRLQALASGLGSGAHLDLYAFAGNDPSTPPAVDPLAADPFADPKWQPVAQSANFDVTDLYIGGPPARYLWVGALFSGDGAASPVVRQLRVEFDYPGYEQYLPAVYRNAAGCGEFVTRFLSLCESFFSGLECEIDSLSRLFDPQAAPERFLPFLAGCMGLELDRNWDVAEQRHIIGQIFRLSGQSGTVAGLRESLRLFAGIDAVIEEPLLQAAWWRLPDTGGCCGTCAAHATESGAEPPNGDTSVLGWTTMLAPAQPHGAVVGSSAVLDQSHLITDEQFGAPLFSDLAYRFSVGVYRSDVMRPEALSRIEAVVERERPAHTAYRICVIDASFRIGLQSRLGIDTVVGGPPRSLELGTGQFLGKDATLAGPAPSLLGADSSLGVTTRLV